MQLFAVVLPLDQPYENWTGCERTLPQIRQDAIRRLRKDADKLRSLAAGLLLQQAVEVYGKGRGLSARELLAGYRVGAHGKPYLAGAEDFCFSISHSGAYVVLAADAMPVGVDVEQLCLREAVARRFFAPGEQAALERAAEPALAFTEIWTRKEACVKRTGVGLTDDFSSFDVTDAAFAAREGICLFTYGCPHKDAVLSICASHDSAPVDIVWQEMCQF